MSTIPTSLTENQFDGHVLPYLSGRYTIRVFNGIGSQGEYIMQVRVNP